MRVGLIGGSAFPRDWGTWPGFATRVDGAPVDSAAAEVARYGVPAAELVALDYAGSRHDLMFLARHGAEHHLLPHEINYRANLALLAAAQVELIVATHTVGGIDPAIPIGGLVLPTQVIDYTYGREHTFGGGGDIRHTTFDTPFAPQVSDALATAAKTAGVALHRGGVYGATQGPRFESPAEIDRMERDGCTLVGMTAMPEAALAAELDIPYASISLVVNAAAGRGSLDMDAIHAAGAAGMRSIQALLSAFLELPVLPQ